MVTTTPFKKALSKDEVANLARELKRRREAKQDWIVPGNRVRMIDGGDGQPRLMLPDVQDANDPSLYRDLVYEIGKFGHRGLAERLQIPTQYYQRMQSETLTLLIDSVNTWLDKQGGNHMLRCLDGQVRAVRSDSYKAIDSADVFFSTVPIINEAGGEVVRADLSEESFMLTALQMDWAETIEPGHISGTYDVREDVMRTLDPNWTPEKYDERFGGSPMHYEAPPLNKTVFVPGIIFGNGECGTRSCSGQLFIFDAVCGNRTLATKGIVDFGSVMMIHSGSRKGEGLIDYSDETRRMEIELSISKLKDAARTAFDRDKFRTVMDKMREAIGIEVDAPVEAVRALKQNYSFLSDADEEAILNEFVAPKSRGGQDPGRNLFGLSAAVTYRAQAYEDPDRQIELEKLGGDIVNFGYDSRTKTVRELVPVKK